MRIALIVPFVNSAKTLSEIRNLKETFISAWPEAPKCVGKK